jgi:Lar family restriction alleviation protein
MQLKPCPFCGELPYLEKKPLWRTVNGSTHGYAGCWEYDIRCHKCGCTIPLHSNDTIYRSDDEAKQNAINTWNRRYTDVSDN